MISYRKTYFLSFLLCCFLLLAALYMQYVKGIEPCLLCMVQRILIMFLGLVFLAACLTARQRTARQVYNGIALVLSVLGLASAIRQVWLQHLPPSAHSYCVPGFGFLIKTAAWKTLLKYSIIGTPECSHIQWTFLGLSIAQWSTGCFTLFALIILWQILRSRISRASP